MFVGRLVTRLVSALACAGLTLSLVATGASAQTSTPVVRVESRVAPGGVAGNLTLTGAAVDCSSGRPATRVAVTDGDNGPYLADAAMDTNASITHYCPTLSGSGQIGWTLIFDTHRLENGRHNLVFTGEFPDGTRGTTSVTVFVDNNSFTPDNSQYYPYNYYYGYPYGYGYNRYFRSATQPYYGVYYGNTFSQYACTYVAVGCTTGQMYPYGTYAYQPYYPSYYYNYPFNYGSYANYPYYNAGYPTGYPNYGGFTISLYQAGQTVPRNSLVNLTGFVSCGSAGGSNVTIYDVTTGTSVPVGTSNGVTGTFAVTWNTTNVVGTRLLQVAASGVCGNQSQTFSVNVL